MPWVLWATDRSPGLKKEHDPLLNLFFLTFSYLEVKRYVVMIHDLAHLSVSRNMYNANSEFDF